MTMKLDLNMENYAWETRCCMGCAFCKYGDWIYVPSQHDFSWICPEWQYGQFDNWGACGRTRIVNGLLYGDIEYEDPNVLENAYKCFNCGACDMACKRNLDLEILMMNQSLKVALVDRGIGPMPAHKQITARIERTGNYFGSEQSERQDWLNGDIKVAKKADVLFFVGCTASFVDKEVAQASARLMSKAGVRFMVLEEETCCGNLLFNTGQLEKFKKGAKINLEKIRATGAKTVVCCCADCLRNLKVEYPKALDMGTNELGFEVLHISELAATLVKEGKLKAKKEMPMKVTYHDACSLGRMSEPWIAWEGIRTGGDISPKGWGQLNPPREWRRGNKGCYEPPRDLLRGIPGVELVEMLRHHNNAYHSGEGGGVKEAFPEVALFAADWRVKEAGLTGASAIVTPCVHSKEMLAGAVMRVKNGIQGVYHIIELVDQVYGR